MPSTDGLAAWDGRFGELSRRIAPRFGRKDLRRHAEGYLRGLMGRVERKNSWQLAEAAGDATPHGLQRLLGRAAGTPTPCATTCAPTSSSTWASPAAC